MKHMTSYNLTLDSFIQHIVDELHRTCNNFTALDIEIKMNEKSIETLYDQGKSVGHAAQFLIAEYNAYHAISDK